MILLLLQRYLALDDRVAWAYYEFHEDLFKGETVEDWVPLSGKMGEGQEGNINVILSLQASTVESPQALLGHLSVTSPD